MVDTFTPITGAELEAMASLLERNALVVMDDIPPLAVYLALRHWQANALVIESDEPKVQWRFNVQCGPTYLEVYDWRLERCSIAAYSADNDTTRDASAAESLRREIAKRAAFNEVRREFGALAKSAHGQVLENPYPVYLESADALLQLASGSVGSGGTVHGCQEVYPSDSLETIGALYRAAFLLYVSAIEGLLNMIYELYLRRELREPRFIERFARDHIDLKLRLAPVYCECFSGTPIPADCEAVRAFSKVIAFRNDFVHANVTRGMKTSVVHQDGHIFFVTPEAAAFLPDSMSALTGLHLELVRKTILDVASKLLDSMQPRQRVEFRDIMAKPIIEITFEDGVPVVIGAR